MKPKVEEKKKPTFKFLHGDSLDVLKTLPENSIDSMVTDPPCGINFMGMKWDHYHQVNSETEEEIDQDLSKREKWIDWFSSIMKEAYRVLKPGAFGLIWCEPRTSHWTMTGLEQAGFEIRDIISHVFAYSMPKGQDIYRELKDQNSEEEKYKGYHSSLKKCFEFWILVRKDLAGTLVENVLQYGTGALNIDGTRVETEDDIKRDNLQTPSKKTYGARDSYTAKNEHDERFTANFIVTHHEECTKKFCKKGCPYYELGEKSRFFKTFNYFSKSSQAERNLGCDDLIWKRDSKSPIKFSSVDDKPLGMQGLLQGNIHPTIKPVDLMEYLAKIVTPAFIPDATIIDPFMGSGTTAIAANSLGFNFIGIEKYQEYIKIAEYRMKYFTEKVFPKPS